MKASLTIAFVCLITAAVQADEPRSLEELNPTMAYQLVTFRFKVLSTRTVSATTAPDATPTFGITPVGNHGIPQVAVIVSGNLAEAMDRFDWGGAHYHDKSPIIGRTVEATGRVFYYPPDPDNGKPAANYQLNLTD